MKSGSPILVMAAALMLGGCASAPRCTPSVTGIVERLGSIDVKPPHCGSYADYCRDVDRRVSETVAQARSPLELKKLFYECHRLSTESPVPQERLTWSNPYWEAEQKILFRLAELRTSKAVETLMELFADEELGFDGESALNVCNAVSRCGRKALPHLAELRSSRWGHIVPDLMAHIEKGELYGP